MTTTTRHGRARTGTWWPLTTVQDMVVNAVQIYGIERGLTVAIWNDDGGQPGAEITAEDFLAVPGIGWQGMQR